MLLTLAERMISKMHKDQKLDQDQETHLYLLVLDMQDKFKEALELLDSDLGKRLGEQTSFIDFMDKKRLHLHKSMENWPEVNLLLKKLIKKW